jgi:hypothetical protein
MAATTIKNKAPPAITAQNFSNVGLCGSVSLFKFKSITVNRNKTMIAPE